ncbi:MAG: response regulator transcription factor [Tissierellia bacterium]|nr:response regulator transcription factor [Tissierellia bacterium]
MKYRILFVEDEKGISKIVTSYLIKEDYEVLQAVDGLTAIKLFDQSVQKGQNIDLILLDRMLPILDGDEVIREIRKTSQVPIIMLTAKVEEEDAISGFQLGADDYVTKPFSPRELMERIKAVLRRSSHVDPAPSADLRLMEGRIEVNFDNYTCIKDGAEVSLTNNEFRILKTLYSSPGKIFTREEIISIAFGMDYEAFDRAIDTHIKNIRHKLEDHPKEPILIRTVYGVGYKAGGLA